MIKMLALLALILLIKIIASGAETRQDDMRVLPQAEDAESSIHVARSFLEPPPEATVGTDGTVEIIVNLEDDRDDVEEDLEAKFGFDLLLNSIYADEANLFRVRVPASEADRILEDIADDEGVEHAEINGVMSAFGFVPDDPLYMFQWNFDQVEAEAAWELATGEGVVVAVIDTGVAFEEGSQGRKRGVLMPDLKETNLTPGYDFVDNDERPYDQNGHGTHVAGTVAQSTDNGYGVAGLAFNASIMPLRVLDGRGRGSFSDVADAIRYAADNGADVINLSLGGFIPSREVEQACAYAHDQGVVVVAAAGNSGTKVRSYPAAFDKVIAVAATQYDRKTTFYSNYGNYIDIAAPGGNTLEDQNGDGKRDGVMQETLLRNQDGSVEFKPTFALYMGTSMASPHVAAAAALLVEQGVSNPDEVEEILKETASDAGKDGWDERYGHGILDAGAAVRGHITETGLWRVGSAFLLALLGVGFLRRRDALAGDGKLGVSFWTGLGLGAGALFFLPLLLGGAAGSFSTVLGFISKPLVTWDSVFAVGSQNPLFVSALPALAATGLLLGIDRGRRFAAGLALASGAVLMVEAVRHTIDVAWLPGVGLLDQSWLALNGLLALVIGLLALKRD